MTVRRHRERISSRRFPAAGAAAAATALFLFSLTVPVAVAAGKAGPSAPGDPARLPIKIFLSEPGIYRVPFEDLVASGWPTLEVSSASLQLRHLGTEVPISVDDGGDGRFGNGDALVFAGDRLPGKHGYFNEYTSLNVYWLSSDPALSDGAALRLQPGRTLASSRARGVCPVGNGAVGWRRTDSCCAIPEPVSKIRNSGTGRNSPTSIPISSRCRSTSPTSRAGRRESRDSLDDSEAVDMVQIRLRSVAGPGRAPSLRLISPITQ